MGDAKTRALVAWAGGWIAGPLPAIVTALISSDLRGTWHYKKIVHAAIFWTALVLVWGTVIVVDIGFRSGPTALFFVGWFLSVGSAVLGTGFSITQLLRRPDTQIPPPNGVEGEHVVDVGYAVDRKAHVEPG